MEGDLNALRRMMDVTSDTDASFEEKLDALLSLGREYLAVEVGFLTRIDDGTQEIVAAAGDHALLQPGKSCPLSRSYCRRTVESDGSLSVQQASIEGWENDAAYETFGLESYVGARVEVEGELYGTFCFADEEPRAESFTDAEIVFVELLAEWVSYELARREIRAALQRERDRLEEFADVVSHDLRNPLSVAKGQLELADETGDADHLRRAASALDRIETLLETLLVQSKAGDRIGRREAVSLPEVVAESWETVDTEDATLVVETTRTVEADPVRLAQLFENQYRNAVQHGGSDVTVTVRDTDDGFAVEDDGPGIPPDERDRVTEAGYTTSGEGTGTGLHIVAEIARAHGWTPTVAESPSGGARFAFGGVGSDAGATERDTEPRVPLAVGCEDEEEAEAPDRGTPK